MSDLAQEQYWFCLTHHTVEPAQSGCANKDRLGPYPTEADAARALEKVKERNEKWDREDAEWDAAGE
ncbi:MAG: hypothetical protein J2O46_07980 [Nocardioides sp.]|nr:hypothetical protein [Nocardioides sp.]